MKTNFSKKTDPNQDIRDELSRIMASNRFIFGFMGLFIGIGLSIGIYISVIGSGIWMGLLLLGLAFDPPYQLLRAILHFGNLPPHLNHVSLWHKIFTCVAMLIPALLIGIGVRGLHVGGFCMQSLICVLADGLLNR